MGLPRLTKTTGTPGAPGAFRGMQNAPSAKFLCSRQPCQGAVAESDACAQKHPQDESIAGILSKTAGYANGAHQCSRSFHIVLLFDHSVKGKSCRAGAGKGRKEIPLPGTRQGRKEGRQAYAILKFNWTVYLRRFHLRIGLLLDIVHHSQGDFHVDVLALGDIVQGDVFAA